MSQPTQYNKTRKIANFGRLQFESWRYTGACAGVYTRALPQSTVPTPNCTLRTLLLIPPSGDSTLRQGCDKVATRLEQGGTQNGGYTGACAGVYTRALPQSTVYTASRPNVGNVGTSEAVCRLEVGTRSEQGWNKVEQGWNTKHYLPLTQLKQA